MKNIHLGHVLLWPLGYLFYGLQVGKLYLNYSGSGASAGSFARGSFHGLTKNHNYCNTESPPVIAGDFHDSRNADPVTDAGSTKPILSKECQELRHHGLEGAEDFTMMRITLMLLGRLTGQQKLHVYRHKEHIFFHEFRSLRLNKERNSIWKELWRSTRRSKAPTVAERQQAERAVQKKGAEKKRKERRACPEPPTLVVINLKGQSDGNMPSKLDPKIRLNFVGPVAGLDRQGPAESNDLKEISRLSPRCRKFGRKFSSDEDGDGPGREGHMTAEMAQQSTTKVPPFWAPELEKKGYPFRTWRKDVALWSAGTELNPDKQGPAIIQRLGGTARELLREVPLELIQLGRRDETSGLFTCNGVEAVVEQLRKRFAQLDVEASITAIIELFTFKRSSWESIDDALTRFELLRSRTEGDAAFQMPVAVLAWQVLVALGVPRTVWPLLFVPCGGALPRTKDSFSDMLRAIRQQGHISEHTHAGPRDLGEGLNGYRNNHYFGQDDDKGHDSDMWGSANSYAGTFQSTSSSSQAGTYDTTHEAYVSYDEEGCATCAACQSYLYEDEWNPDNDTDTEDEQDVDYKTNDEWTAYFGGAYDPADESYASLYEQLMFAKRRFRNFASTGPRRDRFPRKNYSMNFSGKGKGKRKSGYFGDENMIGPNSLAGGKGKGKGKRKGKGKGKGKSKGHFLNACDSSGKVMKCHECDSSDHLVSHCPHRKGGKGKGKSKKDGPRFLTNDRQSQQEAVLQGMFAQDHFYTTDPFVARDPWKSSSLWEDEPRSSQDHFGSSVKIYELGNGESDDDDDKTKSTKNAKQSLWNFPWWHIGNEDEQADTYLVKTRMKDHEGEALLIDPGSPDNLAGDEWSARMDESARRAGRPRTASRPMRRPLEVGGIGSGTQTATQRVIHRIGLANGREANYDTPVLPRSGTPALLGQRSLKKLRALIDCFSGRMYFVGPGGYEIKLSPGSETHELEESHAGHLMLPCSEFTSKRTAAMSEPMQVMTAQSTSSASSTSLSAGATPRPRM